MNLQQKLKLKLTDQVTLDSFVFAAANAVAITPSPSSPPPVPVPSAPVSPAYTPCYPFVKWAGGKTQQLPQLSSHYNVGSTIAGTELLKRFIIL